jgi:hypothetical protein
VPDDWPSFEVALKFDGKSVTVRWQRAITTDAGADRIVAAGDVVRLAELPANALLVVVQQTRGTS